MGRCTSIYYFLFSNILFLILLILNKTKEDLGEDILKLQTDDIISRTRLLENEIKILKSEIMRISHEHQSQKEKIKENKEKIKLNKTLPYLVSNVIEVITTKIIFLIFEFKYN